MRFVKSWTQSATEAANCRTPKMTPPATTSLPGPAEAQKRFGLASDNIKASDMKASSNDPGSVILPQNARSRRRRTARRASRRPIEGARSHVGSLRVAARDRRTSSAPAGTHEIGVARTGARGGAGSLAAPARTRRAPRPPARGPAPADNEDDPEDSAPTDAQAPAAAPRRRDGRRSPSCAVRSGRSPGPCRSYRELPIARAVWTEKLSRVRCRDPVNHGRWPRIRSR
jgi:hypothetical protein